MSKNVIVKSLAIASGKGGTGKSIIAASTAYLLAHCGFKVLLIDMDLFTSGLSFYSLANFPRQAPASLREIFTSDMDLIDLKPIEIPELFVRRNLSILPSISKRRRRASELSLNQKFNNLSAFTAKVKELIHHFSSDFDHIILDTRGGSDVTSIGAIIASGRLLVVTESDKTSWDAGDVLLDGIDEAVEKLNEIGVDSYEEVERLGFIINKNVLPSEAIEDFLRKQWSCPSLAVIPLDEFAIRYFQEDSVPVAVNIGFPFSYSLVPIIRSLFLTEDWSQDQVKILEGLEKSAEKAKEKEERANNFSDRAQKYSILMRIFGTILSTSVLLYFAIVLINTGSVSEPLTIFFTISTSLIVFFMTASEPGFLEKVVLSLPIFTRRRE